MENTMKDKRFFNQSQVSANEGPNLNLKFWEKTHPFLSLNKLSLQDENTFKTQGEQVEKIEISFFFFF